MPRKARPWDPGAIYHVDARGHCGAPIFSAQEDRAFVVERARRAFDETQATCLAWSVMTNHYHMLVRCIEPPGRTFARLNSAIAWRVLRSRGEHGSVFQSRFFSGMCLDEASLLERLGYVLANPVHHHIVPSVSALKSHEWSALGEILGLRRARLADVEQTLSLFHGDPDVARRRLVEFLNAKVRRWREADGHSVETEPAIDVPQSSQAGAGKPVVASNQCAPHVVPVGADDRAATRARLRAIDWDPSRLLHAACAITGADAGLVAAGRRTAAETRARAIVTHVACDVAGYAMSAVAPLVGVRATALLRSRSRGKAVLGEMGIDAGTLLGCERPVSALFDRSL